MDDPSADPEEAATQASGLFEEAVGLARSCSEERLEADCRLSAALALRDRASYDPAGDLAKASEHLQIAIARYLNLEMQVECAEAMAALGSVVVNDRGRYQRASREAIQRSISLIQSAIPILETTARKESTAIAYFYLGQAWMALECQDDPGKGLREAVIAFRRARQMRRSSPFPLQVAMVEEAEANALSEVNHPGDLRKAARLYRRAVKRLGSGHPAERFRILCNLGFAQMQCSSWRLAADAFRLAATVASESKLLELDRRGIFREGKLAECQSSLAYCELELSHLEAALQALESGREIRSHSKRRPFNLSTLLAAERDELIIVSILTPVGSVAVVIPLDSRRCSGIHVVRLPDMGNIQAALQPLRSVEKGGWFAKWSGWRNDFSTKTLGARMHFLDDVLGQLWVAFSEPVLGECWQHATRKLVVLPHGGMQVFPLHAAYREEGGDRRYVATDWIVRYAPSLTSLQVLSSCEGVRRKRILAIGISRYSDPRLRKLALAEAEAKMVCDVKGGYAYHKALVGPDALKERLLASSKMPTFSTSRVTLLGMPTRACPHFNSTPPNREPERSWIARLSNGHWTYRMFA